MHCRRYVKTSDNKIKIFRRISVDILPHQTSHKLNSATYNMKPTNGQTHIHFCSFCARSAKNVQQKTNEADKRSRMFTINFERIFTCLSVTDSKNHSKKIHQFHDMGYF